MGTPIVNPLYAGQYTPTNPTGANIAVPGSAPSSSGANPLLPSLGTSSTAPTSTNPLTAGFTSSSVPTFGANGPGPVSLTGAPTLPATNAGQAAASPIGGMSTMSPTDVATMYNDLKKTYGDGVAHSILDFLTSGAGFNQSAINNLFAAMQPGIERGTESLANQFSTSGNRFGSGAQIGIADYLSQVNLNQGQLETQMYETAINNYLSTLMGVASQNAQRKAATPSALDDALAIAGTVIPGAAMAASALKPTTQVAPINTGTGVTGGAQVGASGTGSYFGTDPTEINPSEDAQQQQMLMLMSSAAGGV
jgi:hypothetical protein